MSKHARPGRSRQRMKIALFTAVALAGAGVTLPALAGTDPDVRLIVGLESADQSDTVERLTDDGYDLEGSTQLEKLGARTVEVPEDEASRIAAKLRNQEGVDFVQLDRRMTVLAEPTTDPAEEDEPSEEDVTPAEETPAEEAPADEPTPTVTDALAQLAVPAALKTATTWSPVTIAVVDTGVTPVGDLTGSVLPGANVIENAPDPADARDDNKASHGTSVASLVKAACPACKILPVKAVDSHGTTFAVEIAEGITYAADKGARIINLSFGAPDQTNNPDSSALLQTAIDYARSRGAIVLASAGNDDRGNLKYFPAANSGVLAVAGTDPAGKRHEGSNFGASWVDLAAPYCATASTSTGGTQPVCGTSFSTALASGVAGLIKSRTAAANQWTLENALTTTATAPAAEDRWLAFGEIRADRAVTKVDTARPVIGVVTPGYMARFRGTVTVTADKVTDAGGSGITNAQLFADGRLIGTDTTAPYAVRYASGTLNRTVKLQWKVSDRAGNVGTLNRNLVADNLAPTLTWKSGPKNKAKVKGTVKIKATASDASGVYRVELWINGKLAQWDWKSAYAFSVKTSKYGKTIKVQLRARDKVGNIRYLTTRTWKR
ncbi:S8 family serine peptidase [Actinoplanes sp. GCM10030250]|uniref:S8 family serine peptidase n=1 Tax=Actinoplanes sp. GCM10030250 TaxID=3273376 RepID=UPI00360ADE09